MRPGLTAGEAFRGLVAELRRYRVPEARLKAEWVMAHLLGGGRWEWQLDPNRQLTAGQRRRLIDCGRRLCAHEPLQYVLGETEFYGRRFYCDRRALIPRAETEELVERVLGCDALWRRAAPHVVDVGTGAGCIAITLALQRPGARIAACDIDPRALVLARRNARRHGVEARIEWRRCDLLSAWRKPTFDAVVANLPYVPTSQWSRLPRHVRNHEPRGALDGGPDGLDPIRRLIAEAPAVLRRDGWIFLEIGDDQGPAVRALLESAGFRSVRVERDLGGRIRFAEARWIHRRPAMNP